MKPVYNVAFWVLCAVLLSTQPAMAKGEFTKTIKKEFETTKDGTTSLLNKYGKVDVKTWDKNRVKIDVRIVVRAGSEAAAQKVFDRINIAFSNTSNYVKAETSIEPVKSNWIGNWGDDKNDFSIYYEVYMPPTNKLELNTKYCDVYVAALQGPANVDVSYGNFKMDGLADRSNIILAYGGGSITKARDVKVEIKYSNIKVQEASDVEIYSKYTTVVFDKAADIVSSSKYDNYKLGQVEGFRNTGKYDNIEIAQAGNVLITSQYTNVKVAKLNKTIDLNMEYGGAVVGPLSKNFTMVNLLGKYTDFKLSLPEGVAYQVDASGNYAGISYPTGLTVTYEREKSSAHEVKGYSGSQSATAVIKARMSYGGLKMKQE